MRRTIDDALQYVRLLMTTHGTFTVSDYARGYQVSRQAASKMLRKLTVLGVVEREGDGYICCRYQAPTKPHLTQDGRVRGGPEFWLAALSNAPAVAYVDSAVLGKARLTRAADAKVVLRLAEGASFLIFDCHRAERVTEAFVRELIVNPFLRVEPINANPAVWTIFKATMRSVHCEFTRQLQLQDEYETS